MRGRVRVIQESVRSHVLFIPGLLVVLGMVLAVALVEADRHLDTDQLREIPWTFRGGASGARQVLATIATSMAQLAGITFSVTIVALALRSQQFGPRLLRNFTGDRLNQVILGTFVATFVYALLVLRAVRDLDVDITPDETFVPLLSVTFSIILALISLGFFVVFIDRVVDSMQVDAIVATTAKETSAAIEDLFPEPIGTEGDVEWEPTLELPTGAVPVAAEKAGYVRSLRSEQLMALAVEHDVVVHMARPIGAFVAQNDVLAVIQAATPVEEIVVEAVRKTYKIGRSRTITQDPEYGARQIADIGIKALSPSQNDPNTAVTAAEYLSSVLTDFAGRKIPDWRRRDEEGEVRVFAVGPTFRSMTEVAFDQLREHARGDVVVIRTLIEAIGRVARSTRSARRLEVLRAQLRSVSRVADEHVRDPEDRSSINDAFAAVADRLGWDPQEGVLPVEVQEARK